jgi:uncharacterized membrane protein YdjX (TVP38/TMEM64 family)
MSSLLSTLVAQVTELGYAGYLLLGLALVLAVLAFVPVSPLCVAAGLAYGPPAIPVVLAALTVGSVGAMLVSRHLLQARFGAALAQRPRLRAAIDAVERDGWWVICLLRFSSPMPATLLCYAVGLTRIGLLSFASACLAGMFVPVVLLVALGAAGHTALIADTLPAAQFAVTAAGLVMAAIAATLVARRTRAILADVFGNASGP